MIHLRETKTIIKADEKDKIMQLLDVARWAPDGANRQVIRWLVINEPAEVHRIAEARSA